MLLESVGSSEVNSLHIQKFLAQLSEERMEVILPIAKN